MLDGGLSDDEDDTPSMTPTSVTNQESSFKELSKFEVNIMP